ncbi:hypothetical protein GCM10010207_77120 [Streptomyces atratus]|nr:hypothetical protein GCM10010207_77120 [Streptomyces atratus]
MGGRGSAGGVVVSEAQGRIGPAWQAVEADETGRPRPATTWGRPRVLLEGRLNSANSQLTCRSCPPQYGNEWETAHWL